jgi:hypothetical protein
MTGQANVTDEGPAVRVFEMMKHEDDLRAQRLGWYLTINGLLFAALGFTWKFAAATPLVLAFSAFGVSLGLSTLATMRVSRIAIQYLRAQLPVEAHVSLTTNRLKELAGRKRRAPSSTTDGSVSVTSDAVEVLCERKRRIFIDATNERRCVTMNIYWVDRYLPLLYLWNCAPLFLIAMWISVFVVRVVNGP